MEAQESKSILKEAEEIRKGSRNSDYGDAVDNFNRIAQMASLMTGTELTPRQCVAVHIATKLSRESYRHKRDNLVDLCGYADIMQEVCENTEVNDGKIQS